MSRTAVARDLVDAGRLAGRRAPAYSALRLVSGRGPRAIPRLARRIAQHAWGAVMRYLDQPLTGYQLAAPNDMPRLYRELRKGDVVLVDGQQRISRLLEYVTQSPWSHCALYVGDELLRRGEPLRTAALARFGDLADRLVIEALIEDGVVAAPLAKYETHNLRVCRPRRIAQPDLDRVVDSVIGDLGKPYDVRNFLGLALRLSPLASGPRARRTLEACLGRCTDLEVICSAMVARAFHEAGHPILPTPRHPTQILPRDFDLSPNFDIVKFDLPDPSSIPSTGVLRPSRPEHEAPDPLREPTTGAR